MDTLYAGDFDSLSKLVDIKWAMGIIEHLSGWTGTDAYTALASQNIIYVGGGWWIAWIWWNLFSEVSDLWELSWLDETALIMELHKKWFK